ncbi:PAS domain S-box protein [Natronomonas sp.]|uniref:hybrid sensor histidine kinase/response regulator n=1 Tax=Natronomonas sp. TaxID=2184060 RepID=UPI002634874B|nr:PAS domain S-box protein [Natronomonas sp.]
MSSGPHTVRVLHVDDDAEFAELTASFLEREHDRLSVETATTAAAGTQRLADPDADIDCVVSDYDMPETNGIEFLETVRQQCPELPFVLFTGKGSEEIASDAISAGVTDYLQKKTGHSQYAVLANRITNAVEQYRSKRRAEASQQRLSLLFEQSPLGVVEWNERFEFARMNDAAEEILGYAESELIGESWERIVPEAERESVSTVVEKLLENDDGYYSRNENVRKNGERIVCEWHNRVVTDDDGEAVAIYSQFRDVTERERRKDELRRSERRYRAVFDDPNLLAGLLDTDGGVIDINRTAMEYADAGSGDPIGDPLIETSWVGRSGADRAEIEAWIDRAADGEYVEFELEGVRPDGGSYAVEGVFRPVRNDDGEIVSLLVTGRDVTRRREREDRLEALNRATGELLDVENKTEAAEVGVELARDVLGLESNGVYFRDGGDGDSGSVLRPAAVTERTRELLGEPPTFDGGDSIAWRVYETGDALALDDVHGDRDRYDAEMSIRSELYLPIGDHGILLAGSTAAAAFDQQDVLLGEILANNVAAAIEQIERTERLRARTRELGETNREMEATETQLESQYRLLFEEAPIMAVIARDVEGRPVIEDCNDRFLDTLGVERNDAIGSGLAAYYTPDSAAELLESGGFERAMSDVSGTERRDLVAADGETVETLLRAVPYYDDGETVGTVAMYVDISERERLKRANERLEEFTGIVSHDLRNPLRAAEGRLALAREGASDSEHLAAVDRAHDRMNALIEDLLALAQEGDAVTDAEEVDIAELVERCWATVGAADTDLRVETDGTVRGDPGRLRRLLENLFANAIEHGGEGVTVTVGAFDSGLYVEDDGPGISEDERGDVFEPGYSTGRDGTGFGLSIVERIVDAHGWEIRATESADGGARFEITGVGIDPA